ncbi:hypothetical protein C8A03DRAFT_19986 [Achaetomium macrosporum]|uniref:Uncharacterized protein n=1 Tax=Achaetomium macrosporum TaxID=79813 RepID=A0AAN7C0D0_9PEZI|nr:hypothetical protein C8A03DRAFT_19986 [Achaetomium macrosporum]
MFKVKRIELLDTSGWKPSPERGLLGYIEAWWVTDEDLLTDDKVDDWIHQRHEFAAPRYSSSSPDISLSGRLSCIRLLMCERLSESFYPPEFAMSRRSFIQVEKLFGLPQATLPLICRNTGMEYYRLEFDAQEGNGKSPPSISAVIKYPQVYQLGNLGFSMTHSFASGNTLAFLHGWSIFSGRNQVTGEKMVSHGERIHKLLESSVSLWRHPLVLPTLLLQEHLFRCEEFIWRFLSPRIQKIENDLGVTRSGRLVQTPLAVPEEIKELLANDERRIQIASAVNTTLVDTITVISILKWDKRLSEFIKRADKELQKYYKDAKINTNAEMELDSAVDHFSCEAISSAEYVSGMRSRLEIQLTVLYNFVAQAGNELNARIAATTSLDSAAMKTLAFVTTIFLPLSFVASLFSIPVFDWQASSEDGSSDHSVASSRFWIYWVVSVPLTAATLLGWRLWWKRQKDHYAMEYPQVLRVAGKGKCAGVKEV